MKEAKTNKVRDELLRAAPDHTDKILDRDAVVNDWCRKHGKVKDDLSMADILEIRKLPEWKNAADVRNVV